jgi:hypothetical protein
MERENKEYKQWLAEKRNLKTEEVMVLPRRYIGEHD